MRVALSSVAKVPWFRASIYSPFHLGRNKGLEDVVLFLIDSGALLDGPAGHKTTTLLGALFAPEKRIAMLLLRCGASLYALVLSMLQCVPASEAW